ncbi:thioredoxin domain-containing protein [Gimesia aquarii]|uniref:Thioredoxin-like fold domain-containing protein n=1 Tax=Gimesia aquarii TaxID=2527964 RepID=A0A517VRH1_9PLAN|nr:hypothetical protein [Gimesia aquarii]QDT95549.1 hypothetical protein V144x_09940 [Gimesia aquarii]
MKTYLVLISLIIVIAVTFLCSTSDAQQNKSDQFEMPIVRSSPAGKASQAKKLPTLYILTSSGCAPCERFKNEILGRSERARWLLNNHKILYVNVSGFPSVMSTNGSQFTWPAGCWNRDASPLKALTDKLGFKEKKTVGIKDLEKMNADLILSDFSGISQEVQCIPPNGHLITEPIHVQGDFLEDENAALQVDRNSEKIERTAVVDLPRIIEGSPEFDREWSFVIDNETWLFNGVGGKEANVQTVLLKIPEHEQFTGANF